MTAAGAELRTLIDEWTAPPKKTRLFGKKPKGGARLESARRLVQLVGESPAAPGLIEALERASAEFGDDREIRRAYARSLAEGGRIGEAIAEFEERLQASPDDAEDLCDVAGLYQLAKRIDLAVDRLRRAVDIFVARGGLDEAVSAARQLIVLEPQSLETAVDLVAILRTRDPALLAEGIEHLADVYRERGKLGQEAAACRELLALLPDREDVRQRLSAILVRILEVDPDDQDAWFGLATIDEELAARLRQSRENADEQPAAAAVPSRVTKLENHKAYVSRKAQELMEIGDMVGASLCLERLVRTNPDPANHLRLAKCYAALHREPEAVEEALRAVAVAQMAEDQASVDEVLDWIGRVDPEKREPVSDVLFLNHRPKSADILYEELLGLWEAPANAGHSVRATEKPEGWGASS